jgi:EAL domain-containing protein (putative c-di-GMP-specific phosphodiesterase class I)
MSPTPSLDDLTSDLSLDEFVRRALATVNEACGTVAAAFVEFVDGKRVVRAAEGDLAATGIVVGAPHKESGTSASAPVRLLNGETTGTVWATRGARGAHFGDGDIELIARVAGRVAEHVERARAREAEVGALRARISAVLAAEQLDMVFQPIVDLVSGQWKGVESLARFTAEPRRTPDVWFKEAWIAGLGEELEMVAVRKALNDLALLPDGMYCAINVSPETIVHANLPKVLAPYPADRIVVEVTEHAVIADYDAVLSALEPLRATGIRLAVDDAGSGYSSMTHIIKLRPDIIKLDGTVTNHILEDPTQHAMTKMMVMFAAEIGARVVAEVVETAEHASRLRELAVHTAQGWYFSKPRSPAEIAAEVPKA